MRLTKWIKSRRGCRENAKPPGNPKQSDFALEKALALNNSHLHPVVEKRKETILSPLEVLEIEHWNCAFQKDFGTTNLSRLKDSIEPYLGAPVGVHLADLQCHCLELFKITQKQYMHNELLRRPALSGDAEIIMLGGCCFIADHWISLSFRRTSHCEQDVSCLRDTMTFEQIPKLEQLDQNVGNNVSLFQLDMVQGRRWLEKCLNHHQKCRSPTSDFVPHRLLFIGDWRADPILVERFDKTVVPYAALSYCWGAAEVLVTQTSNIMDHFNGIDFECLPRTIRHAIWVCRNLEIPYLWVDALCIVQDSNGKEDWYTQSSQMNSIYANAKLVITADAATCSREGFLDEKEGRVCAYARQDATLLCELRARVSWGRGKSLKLSRLPLSKRGWTMQECILPRRLLHFTRGELIWECNTACGCQCGSPGLHECWKRLDHLQALTLATMDPEEGALHINDMLRGTSDAKIYWCWERIVEDYSQRSLTILTDKLAAVSGLAQDVRQRLGVSPTNFLAGMWRDDLPNGLLWHVTGSPPPLRPNSWRAPSWSWASCDGGIGYFYERYQCVMKPSVTIIGCLCTPLSLNSIAGVRTDNMTLRGYLFPVILDVRRLDDDSNYKGQYIGHSGRPPRAFPDLFARTRFGDKAYEVLLDFRMDCGLYSEDYFSLHIARRYFNNRPGVQHVWLLLHKREAKFEASAEYERVGIGMLNTREWDIAISNEVSSYLGEVVLV